MLPGAGSRVHWGSLVLSCGRYGSVLQSNGGVAPQMNGKEKWEVGSHCTEHLFAVRSVPSRPRHLKYITVDDKSHRCNILNYSLHFTMSKRHRSQLEQVS